MGAHQWWEEWQLRVLVLGSLFVQSIISLLATQRKRAIPSWFRSIIWLTHIGGDALAIYAFATLFNRQKQQTTDRGSRTLELMWAPILLMHLGGQASINTYSLEDSKLWKQYLIMLVSKVIITLYIFIKWWSGSKRLTAAVAGLLIIGILKFVGRPFDLWIGSYDTLVSNIAESPQSKEEGELLLEEYVERTKQFVREPVVGDNGYQASDILIKNSLKMFADLPALYSCRLKDLQSFLKLDEKEAYAVLQSCFDDIFVYLYIGKAFLLLYMAPVLGLISFSNFIITKKDGYNVNDVKVTYIVLCWFTILEILTSLSAIILGISSWHCMVRQYTLMSCALRKKPTTIQMKLANFKCIQKFLHEHWYEGQVPVALQITELVRRQVREWWNMYIQDVASYRVFNNCRGQWTLHRLVLESDHQQRLRQSLKVPFDKSVLLWHIATDLCFHDTNTSPQGRQDDATKLSKEISNYMFYLLATRPEMLMPGTRPDLSTAASNDVHRILEGCEELHETEEIVAREIIEMMKLETATTGTETTRTLIHEACRLAEALMELRDEKKRWQVIQGVWVEMLCYSAARCRGYLHAKSLGDGGEYLSYVWLLWSFMGMETLGEKIQRPEPPREEEITAAVALASPSQGGVDQTVEIHMPQPPGEEEITAAGALASPFQGGVDQTGEIVFSPV